ncbi:MAG: flavin reductase [Chloroflexi bacterium]|nr:flavin reductase [Chloroflexota bacterium]
MSGFRVASGRQNCSSGRVFSGRWRVCYTRSDPHAWPRPTRISGWRSPVRRERALPPSKEDFRRTMGYFATGVTVVTTAHNATVRGMTANSVASVSLDPLSVLVCVNREAITHRILSAGGVFCVNILSDKLEALARACARPDSPEAELTGVPFHPGESGAPVLDDALAYIDCRVGKTAEFGTHTVFFGEAVDVGTREGLPLFFYRGQYGKPGDGLEE